MKTDSTPLSTRLAPPGAGLPAPELLIARLRFRLGLWLITRKRATELIESERDAILELVRSCDSAKASRRVLIARLRGMEDSSRDWSVYMTLDHLRIIHGSIARVIGALGSGHVPPGAASTAAVKPSPDADASSIAGFTESCSAVAKAAAAIPDLKTSARYAHPWFGPLDAAGWHYMVGFHMGLHRQQIIRILAGL